MGRAGRGAITPTGKRTIAPPAAESSDSERQSIGFPHIFTGRKHGDLTMKKFLIPGLLAVALVATSGFAAFATEIEERKPQSPAPRDPEAQQRRQLANLMERYRNIGLTEDQKNQIRPLLKAQLEELRAVRMNTNLSDDARQTQARSILDEYREQVAAVLTAEQKAQLEANREANLKSARSAGTIKRRGTPIDDND